MEIYNRLKLLFFASIVGLCMSGCKAIPIGNGGLVTGISGKAGSVTSYTITIPEGVLSAMVVASGRDVGSVEVEILDAKKNPVGTCNSLTQCTISTPGAGNYTVNLKGRADFSDANISAAWVGPWAESLPVGSSEDLSLKPHTIKLDSTLLQFLSTGDGSASDHIVYLYSENELKNLNVYGWDDLGSELSFSDFSVHGMYSGVSGVIWAFDTDENESSGDVSPTIPKIGLEGVWAMTNASASGPWIKNLFSIFSTTSVAASSEKVVARSYNLSRTACEAANDSGTWEFVYDANNRTYALTVAEAGGILQRTVGGCTYFPSAYSDTYPLPGTSDRIATDAYLTALFTQEGADIKASFISPNKFKMNINVPGIEGSWAIMSKLVCEGGNIDTARFDLVKKLEGGLQLKAYYVKPANKFPNSGITISWGIDLGGQTEYNFKKLGIPSNLIDLLKPAFGYKGVAAQNWLAQNSIEITNPQAVDLYNKFNQDMLQKLIDKYNKDSKVDFCSIPEAWQSVIISMEHQYGSLQSKTPNFWKQITQQNWADAINNLKNFHDQTPPRRQQEAEYVETHK